MTADLLDEADARAAEIMGQQQGGRFPHLGIGAAAVMGLLLEIIAEAVTDQDQRMAAAERQVSAQNERMDALEREIARLKAG
jgi:uncharacterized membrane protein (DUF106 family)